MSDGDEQPTLEEQLKETPRAAGEAADTADLLHPVALFRHLEQSGRFSRDRALGRVYHPGAVSLRENVASDSLHIVIDGNRVSAHVDRVSPLGLRAEKPPRYTPGRIALHNAAGIAADVGRVLRGRQGDHRCELDCEWVPDGSGRRALAVPLLDPEASPWGIHLEARVAGRLDERRLRAAVRAIVPGDDVLSVVDCPGGDALEQERVALQQVAVPVEGRPPLRATLCRSAAGDVVMLNVNHAAADVQGALTVLRALARAYRAVPARMAPLDFLASHELPVRPVAPNRPHLARRYYVGLEKARDALARPTRLQPDPAGADQPGHGFVMVSVDEDDPASLRPVANPDLDNDVLLAALHLAIAAWNTEHGKADGRIAVLVPVDLRTLPWREHIIGNFSVTARVITSAAERSSPAEALSAVIAQTARNIRTRTGTGLIQALDRNNMLLLWARQSVVVLQPLTANHLLDSAVLSYLGRLRPISFGDAKVVELFQSVPSRMPHGLSVGAAFLGGRLHLAFRYPHRLFSPEAARRFAQAFLAQVRLVATAPRAES